MKGDIAPLKASLKALREKIEKFLPVTATSAEISELYDATAHSQTKLAKEALDSLAKRISEYEDLDQNIDMPKATVGTVISNVSAVQQLLYQIEQAVRKKQGNENVRREDEAWFNDLTGQIEAKEGLIVQSLLPWKQKGSAEMTIALDAAAEKAKQAEQKLATIEDAASRIQQQLEKKTQEAAVTVLSEVNLREIDSSIEAHETSARYWLIAFISAACLSFRLIVWMFSEGDNLLWPLPLNVQFRMPPIDPTLPQALMSSIGKLVVTSFAFGLLLLTTRIYQTHAHNAIVNRHRRLAFISYQKLHAVIKDDVDSRQILVQQAAAAIFAHTATGFLQKGAVEFGINSSILQEGLKTIRSSSASK